MLYILQNLYVFGEDGPCRCQTRKDFYYQMHQYQFCLKVRIKVLFKNRQVQDRLYVDFFPDQTLCTKGEKRGENVYDERTYFFYETRPFDRIVYSILKWSASTFPQGQDIPFVNVKVISVKEVGASIQFRNQKVLVCH